MSLVSNVFSTSVQAATTSALASAAASMSSGQWLNVGAQINVGGLALFESGSIGASGIRTPYCSVMVYDAANKRLLMHSGDHAESAQLFIFEETTGGSSVANAWRIDHIPAWMVVVGATAVHGYNHPVFAKGVLYSRKIQQQSLQRWDGYGTTTWTTIPITAGPGGNISAAGHCWHAGLNKILVHQLGASPNGILVGYDPDLGTWTTYSLTLNGTGDPHNFAVYNEISQLAWFGGGNNTTTNWTIGNAGTSSIRAMDPLPQPCGSSNSEGRALANPTNGNFMLFADGNHWYDLDPTTGHFTQRTAPATAFLTNLESISDPGSVSLLAGVIGCAMFNYPTVGTGRIVFQKSWARNTPGEMWMLFP